MPVDAAASEARSVLPGVLGASSGKIMIQTLSQGMPGTSCIHSPVHSGKTPHMLDIAMPKAPTTSKMRPMSRSSSGRSFANRESANTAKARAMEAIATIVWIVRSALNRRCSAGTIPSWPAKKK